MHLCAHNRPIFAHGNAKFGPDFVAVVAVTFHFATATEMAERRNVQDSNDDVFIADSCI